jgi:signal transduction histidine kinase/BarA-like signal transduction histidine kinase
MELTTLCYLLLVPLVSATMLSTDETRRWFARVAVVGSAVVVAGHLGAVLPEVDPLPVVTRVLNFTWSLGAAMALLGALAQERERSLDRLREAERAKSAFFANVGHEIRTPMNGVLGMTEALLAHPLGPEERAMAETIRASGGVLMALIDDLLDLSKLEAGRLELREEAVALRGLQEELRALWTPLAVAKRLTLAVALDPELPPAVRLDGVRLRQVLGNLVSNAIKFTPSGSVSVRLGAEGDWLTCAVEDTGIGISPAQAGRLFERFVQADDARARRYQGTGLGLALSRELAVHMGGTLEVASTEGQGSRFSLRLPLRPAPLPPGSAAAGARLPPGLKVLVVDDNAVNRLVATRLLDRQGCQVVTAEDGPGALAALASAEFDVVLMDVHMPVMDGLEATRQIRAQPGRGRLPIIAVSASAASEDIESCRQAGMNDFLAKPVTRDRVVETLLRHL